MSMRARIENWLLDIWYVRPHPPWYLRMLVPLYRAAYRFDHRNDSESKSETAPTALLLVVGNITVGGSGKTPLVIALCNMATESGFRVGVATTGYGRDSQETLKVHADSSTSECGDEPVLIAMRTGVPVVVAKSRQSAIDQLKPMNLDIIISDDGLQSAGLQRDLEICVVDGARGLGNGYLLPAGPLRESASRLHDVDYVISNGNWTSKPTDIKTGTMRLEGDVLHSLVGSGQRSAAELFSGQAQQHSGREVHVFAGIGNPDRFFNALWLLNQKAPGGSIAEDNWHQHRRPDHHTYQKTDFENVPNGATIVMTEKDAVKCRKLGLDNAWYLPVDAVLDEDFVHWYTQQMNCLEGTHNNV